MSNETLTILLTALPPTLAAIAGLVVSIKNGKKSNEIHTLVNSNLSQVRAELSGAKQEIGDLRQLVGKLLEQKKVAEAKE